MAPVVPLSVWITFLLFVALMLALDLGVFNRPARPISVPRALCWTAVWIGLALVFCAGLFRYYPRPHGAVEFLTGYLVEYALSVDNIFVFLLIFGYFQVPPQHQHKVLYWGILGAIVMRGLMIFT